MVVNRMIDGHRCTGHGQAVTSRWFEERPRRDWTLRSPGGEAKNHIDYITISKGFRRTVQLKQYPGADCGLDSQTETEDTKR